jgi:glycyl-tRNA synthetase
MLQLYTPNTIPFWTEDEIEFRELFQARVVTRIKQTLTDMNKAWRFHRIEGPCLSPRYKIGNSYDDSDIFVTNHKVESDFLCLRAETTPSSYEYARFLNKQQLPLCVWQSGKSFRREVNDGATAAKLRFNEFYQLEFQCIYSNTTKADYRSALIDAVEQEIERFTQCKTRVVESDRLPLYSDSTLDIEVYLNNEWREIASCSIRNDFSENTKVAEIAIGLDRVVIASDI